MQPHNVSVIIPNYNGRHLLPDCLEALSRQSYPPGEIVVVDDGSTDGSAQLVRERYPQVTLLALEANRGFCHAVNAGLRSAGGELLALLNNDTEVDPGWLAALVAASEEYPRHGFFACRMRFFDQRDRINSAGLFLRVDGVGRDIGFGAPDGPAFDRPREVFGASNGAALYRRALLDDVGLLDEDLVAYAEDLDLSFRARLRGWSCLYAPSAIVYHRLGATFGAESPSRVYLGSRNMLTVLLKNMPFALLRRYWPLMLAAQAYQLLYFAARGRGRAALRGKADALRSLGYALAKRRTIQRARRATDEQIAAALTPWRQYGRFAL